MNRAYIIRCVDGQVDTIIPTANIPNPSTFIARFPNYKKTGVFDCGYINILGTGVGKHLNIKFNSVREFLNKDSACDANVFMCMMPENVWYFSDSIKSETLRKFS